MRADEMLEWIMGKIYGYISLRQRWMFWRYSLKESPHLYEGFSLIRIQLEGSGVMAGQVGDVLPARPGHHLTGGDHTDGGGRHWALR